MARKATAASRRAPREAHWGHSTSEGLLAGLLPRRTLLTLDKHLGRPDLEMPVGAASHAPAARDTVKAPNGITTAVLPGSSAPQATGMPAALQSTPSLADWRTPIKPAAYRAAELLRWVDLRRLFCLEQVAALSW